MIEKERNVYDPAGKSWLKNHNYELIRIVVLICSRNNGVFHFSNINMDSPNSEKPLILILILILLLMIIL